MSNCSIDIIVYDMRFAFVKKKTILMKKCIIEKIDKYLIWYYKIVIKIICFMIWDCFCKKKKQRKTISMNKCNIEKLDKYLI